MVSIEENPAKKPIPAPADEMVHPGMTFPGLRRPQGEGTLFKTGSIPTSRFGNARRNLLVMATGNGSSVRNRRRAR